MYDCLHPLLLSSICFFSFHVSFLPFMIRNRVSRWPPDHRCSGDWNFQDDTEMQKLSHRNSPTNPRQHPAILSSAQSSQEPVLVPRELRYRRSYGVPKNNLRQQLVSSCPPTSVLGLSPWNTEEGWGRRLKGSQGLTVWLCTPSHYSSVCKCWQFRASH